MSSHVWNALETFTKLLAKFPDIPRSDRESKNRLINSRKLVSPSEGPFKITGGQYGGVNLLVLSRD